MFWDSEEATHKVAWISCMFFLCVMMSNITSCTMEKNKQDKECNQTTTVEYIEEK